MELPVLFVCLKIPSCYGGHYTFAPLLDTCSHTHARVLAYVHTCSDIHGTHVHMCSGHSS